MGRAPCCDKANVKKGPWSPEEDAKLKSYIEQHGTGGNWIALPQKIGLKRCGKSCRLRWLNYLRPNIKHGGFSEEEDNLICSLYISIGSRWSIIAAQLPGRTDNDIKNYWNTRLKKKLLGKQRKEQQAARRGQKQDLSRGTSANGIAHPAAISHHQSLPYWPEMPPHHMPAVSIPYSNQEPRFNDHASIRKLLIKLGGRFSEEEEEENDDHKTSNDVTMNLPFPIDVSSAATEQQLYDGLSIMDSSSGGGEHQFGNSYMDAATSSKMNHFQMMQGQSSNYPVPELEEMVYINSGGARLEGLEFLYGQDNNNNNMVINNREESSWSEMSSLVIAPNSVLGEEGAFDDGLRYTPAATGRV